MTETLKYELVDGIKCYSPEVADCYDDYPDSGFALTEKLESESFWVRSRSRLLKKIIGKLSLGSPKTNFLEIGCGTGTFIREIADNASLAITGSEIYLKGLLFAKKKLPNVEFVQFDVTKGIISENFNIVAAFDVLEHINDDATAISNIYKMLNVGGSFVVTVPQHMFLWSSLDEIVKHKRRYSRKELADKLKKQGFTVSFCSSFLFVLFPLMLASRFFDRRSGKDDSSGENFEKKVSFPKALNTIFDKLMRIDEFLIEKKMSLPFGGSLLMVAKKETVQ